MFFISECTYHVFNRSNETVFYNRENYIFFLGKIREHILPYADVLSYCLMPNHFHLLCHEKTKNGLPKPDNQPNWKYQFKH